MGCWRCDKKSLDAFSMRADPKKNFAVVNFSSSTVLLPLLEFEAKPDFIGSAFEIKCP